MSALDAKIHPSTRELSTDSEVGVDHLERSPTVEVENYHGMNAKIILVILALGFMAIAQMCNLVGSGLLARDIAAVVGGSNKSSWLSQTVGILTAAIGPPVAQAADYWGRKWFLVTLTGLGAIGSIIISRSHSMDVVILGEVVASLMYGAQPLYYAVVSEIVPRRFRPAVQAWINICLGIGAIFTLLVGSFWVQHYTEGFRIFFYFDAAILLVAALICAVLYNPPKRPLQKSLTNGEKIKQLDWVGCILLAVGIVLFDMGLTWAENPYPWKSAHVLTCFLLGAALLAALAVYQTWFKKDGLFHHGLFSHDRNFAIALVCIFVEGLGFFAANGFLPYECSVLYDTSLIIVGLRFCTVFFASILTAAGLAVYVAKFKSIRTPTALSFGLFVVYYILMATATLESSHAVWGYAVILGLGIGVGLTSLVTAAQLSAPPHLIAIATGLMIGVRSLGGAVGYPIYNSIFNSSLTNHLGTDIAAAVLPLGLSPRVLPELIGALASNNQKALIQIPGITPEIIGAAVVALKGAYLHAFRGVWITGAAFSLVAAIAACFLIDPKRDLNNHVDAPLDDETPEK